MRRPLQLLPLAAFALSSTALFAGDLEKGLAAFDVGDYETSLAECQPLAEEGNAAAQFCVGRLYANGFGVPMDDAKALYFYGAAADQGYPQAQYNLGIMHANGWGVTMNDEKAAEFYREAAVKGYGPAIMSLAEIRHRGMGVEKDEVDAYAWYIVAANLGNMDAELKRDAAAKKLSPEDQASGQKMAEDRLKVIDAESMHVRRAK
jgi:TPR repeat protein